MTLLGELRIYKRQPRPPLTIGVFGSYDANIIGGSLIGVGMGITGACPGTLVIQASTGIPSGRIILIGGVIGGTIYSKISPYIRQRRQLAAKSIDQSFTIHDKLGLGEGQAILAFEITCLAIVGLASLLGPASDNAVLNPIFGGLLVGFAQGISLIVLKSAIGVSGAYEQAGDIFWYWIMGQRNKDNKAPAHGAIIFALGVSLGGWLLTRSMPAAMELEPDISIPAAILGGIMLSFGARLAGGCTAGHGISGMSSLGISSFITVASMFSGGVITMMVRSFWD